MCGWQVKLCDPSLTVVIISTTQIGFLYLFSFTFSWSNEVVGIAWPLRRLLWPWTTVISYQLQHMACQMGDRGYNRHGPKRGGCCEPLVGAGNPSSIECGTMWSTSVASGVFVHRAIWPQSTWAKNWVGLLCPFLGVAGSTSNTMLRRPGRGAVCPSSTMWTGPRLTSMPSAILIHPAVRPQ